MEEQVINLEELFKALKKRWLIIIGITLMATIISATLSFFVIKPMYEANTKVFIGKEVSSDNVYNQSDVIMYQQLMKTYSETVKTKDLINEAIDDAKLELNVEDVLSNLTVVNVADTQILEIKYKSNNPEDANNLLKSISDEFIKTSEELVPNGNVKIIESVELPENPISPNKKNNIVIAFILGLIIGIGLALILDFLDNTVKNKEQLEREFEIPVIGSIPKVKGV